MLAPFNSTITNEDFFKEYFCQDVPIERGGIIKFSDKVREANRQYEFNYNDEVDNGIMISMNAQEENKAQTKDSSDKEETKDNVANEGKKQKASTSRPESVEMGPMMKAPQASIVTEDSAKPSQAKNKQIS